MKCKKPIYLILCCISCWVHTGLHSQNVGNRTDRSQILIGEWVQYDLLIRLPALGYRVDVDVPESIPHFEIVSQSNFDTSTNNNGYSLHQTIVFTSFDSGKWYIPSFAVTLQKDNDFKKFITDSALVNVGYSPPDSTNELRDIRPIMEVEVVDYFWWFVAGGILAALLIAFALYRYLKYRKEKPVPVLHSLIGPYEEAMNDLEALAVTPLTTADDIKIYHSQLSFIIKRYYSRQRQVNYLNKTTGDFLLQIKGEPQESTFISLLAGALCTGDAVKFAKYMPTPPLSRESLEAVKKAINIIHNK